MDCLYLMYADDLKLFRRINTQADADILQSNLDKLQSWCETNKMSLSISKCGATSLTRKTRANLISCVYNMASEPLVRKTVANDLKVRVLLDEN